MYHAIDVSRFIINYSNEKDYGISNLKLQKVLYFVQAYFLMETEDHSPCFSEDIQAWNFGPVVPEVYYEYKQYGSNNIPYIKYYIEFDKQDIWNTRRIDYKNEIQLEDQNMIKDVVDTLSKYSASDLVDITHRQSPWKDAYKPYANNVITIESMKRYFLDEK